MLTNVSHIFFLPKKTIRKEHLDLILLDKYAIYLTV